MQVWLGVSLLAVATAGAMVALRDWPLWSVLRRVRPTSPERLMRAAGDGHLDGRVVAVSGLAGPGPGGELRSTVNHEPCVWHRHTVHRRQIRYRAAGGATTQRYSLWRRRVADMASREPFLLRPLFPRPSTGAPQPVPAARLADGEERTVRFSPIDGLPEPGGPGSAILVRPEGMRVHRPAARGLRILPALASEPFPESEALLGRVRRMYWHREWVLRAGVPLLALAELRSGAAGLVLCRPVRGPHIISTRTAASLRRRAASAVLVGLGVAAIAGTAGALALTVPFG